MLKVLASVALIGLGTTTAHSQYEDHNNHRVVERDYYPIPYNSSYNTFNHQLYPSMSSGIRSYYGSGISVLDTGSVFYIPSPNPDVFYLGSWTYEISPHLPPFSLFPTRTVPDIENEIPVLGTMTIVDNTISCDFQDVVVSFEKTQTYESSITHGSSHEISITTAAEVGLPIFGEIDIEVGYAYVSSTELSFSDSFTFSSGIEKTYRPGPCQMTTVELVVTKNRREMGIDHFDAMFDAIGPVSDVNNNGRVIADYRHIVGQNFDVLSVTGEWRSAWRIRDRPYRGVPDCPLNCGGGGGSTSTDDDFDDDTIPNDRDDDMDGDGKHYLVPLFSDSIL